MIDPLWKGLQFWLVMDDRDSVFFILDNYLSILSPCIIYHTRISQCTGITSEVSAKFGQVFINIDTFHIFIFQNIFKFFLGRVPSLAHIPRCEFHNDLPSPTFWRSPKSVRDRDISRLDWGVLFVSKSICVSIYVLNYFSMQITDCVFAWTRDVRTSCITVCWRSLGNPWSNEYYRSRLSGELTHTQTIVLYNI